jgi:hypothetical protein
MPNQPNTGAARAAALPGASGEVVSSGEGEYLGYAVNAGAAAVLVVLYDNATAASGPILDVIYVPASQAASGNYPRPGRQVTTGIYASYVTGTPTGSVFQ